MSERPDEQEVEAFVLASRAFVAIAARALDDLQDDLSLPQFRALVVLGTRGSANLTQLAEDVGVHQSTASRLVSRLVEDGLIERRPDPDNRRKVVLSVTAKGRELYRAVHQARREDIARVVARLDPEQRRQARDALVAFAAAAGEQPDSAQDALPDPRLEDTGPGSQETAPGWQETAPGSRDDSAGPPTGDGPVDSRGQRAAGRGRRPWRRAHHNGEADQR